MKDPRNLSKSDLAEIVSRVRNWIWMTEDHKDMVRARHKKVAEKIIEERNKVGECCIVSFFDPDTEWDSDTTDRIAEVLTEYGLRPKAVCPISAGYKYDRWGDDELQFARLLDELQAVGVTNLMKEAEWQAIESSMDLKREDIMTIFDRAQRRWDQAKADLKKEQKTAENIEKMRKQR